MDAAAILQTLFILTGLALSLAAWGQEPPGTLYNTTFQELIWQIASLLVIAMGIVILFSRRPNGWINGLAVLLLALAGHSLHLIFGRTGGNYPGIVRVAYMAIYPFLMTLPQRFPMPAPRAPSSPSTGWPGGRGPALPARDPERLPRAAGAGRGDQPRRVSSHTAALTRTLLAGLPLLMHIKNNRSAR